MKQGWEHRGSRGVAVALVCLWSLVAMGCATDRSNDADRRLPRGYDPMGPAVRAMGDSNRPESMRVAFVVREYGLPLDEPIDQAWASTRPAPDGAGVLRDWRENGIRIAVLKEDAVAEFTRALPVLISEHTMRHVTAGDAVAIATTRITRSGTNTAESEGSAAWRAQPVPWSDAVGQSEIRSGRVDLLMRTAPGAGGRLGMELWPQHLSSSGVRPQLAPGSNPSDGGRLMAPGDLRLSGEVIVALHTTTQIAGDEALVIGLNRRWPKVPASPPGEHVWPNAIAGLGTVIGGIYPPVYEGCERPLFPAICPPTLERSCGSAWFADPDRRPGIQRLLVISRIPG